MKSHYSLGPPNGLNILSSEQVSRISEEIKIYINFFLF